MFTLLTTTNTTMNTANDIKNLTLSRDMFSSHTLVFFYDEQIGSIDDKTNLTFAYPLGSTQGAPFHSHEGALRFLMDVRNKSVTGKCVSVQAKQQLSIFNQ